MNAVFFKRTEDYGTKQLNLHTGLLLDALKLGNLSGTHVLIKPDFLYMATPGQAVTTHPKLLKTVCAYFLDNNAKVSVGVRHLSGRLDRFLQLGGYRDALAGMPIALDTFKRAVTVEFGDPIGKINLPREVIETELFVNLPKLKTHSLLGLNACVSNIFDCITLREKRQSIAAVNGDIDEIGQLMAKIAHTLLPEVNLVDGIMGLQGQGPGVKGRPAPYSILVSGANPFCMDWALASFIGFEQRPEFLEQAARLGLFDPYNMEIVGEFHTMSKVEMPPRREIFPVPAKHATKAVKSWYQKVVQTKSCNLCGACAKACPGGAISLHKGGKRVSIDPFMCLHCYSCVAACPNGLLSAEQSLEGKMARRYYEKRMLEGALSYVDE